MRETDRQFFRPLWRRVLATAVVAVWCAIEWWYSDPFWGMLTGAVLAYCVWAFFLTFDGNEPTDTSGDGE